MEVQVATRKARGTAARELSSIGNAMAGARDKLTDLLLKPGEEHKVQGCKQFFSLLFSSILIEITVIQKCDTSYILIIL